MEVEAVADCEAVGVVEQEEYERKKEDKVVPYSDTPPIGNLEAFFNELTISPTSQSKVIVETQKASAWYQPITDFWNWLTGAEEKPEEIPLTDTQKAEIQRIFVQASAVGKDADEKELEEVLTLTKALVDVYKEIYSLRDLAIRNQADVYGKKKEWVDQKRAELNKKRDKLLATLENKNIWQKLVAAAGPIGLAYAGATALTGAWAFAAVGAACLLALEELSGGKAKEAIAKMASGDDTIKQQNIEYYLGMTTSVLCLAGSIVATKATTVVRMAATLTQVPVMIGEGYAQRKADLAMSGENTIKHEHKKAMDKLASEGKKVNKYDEDFSGKVKKLIDILNNNTEQTIGLFR